MSAAPHFAYIFERFPSFTQTFCAREVMELQRRGVRLALFSIRDVRDEEVNHFPQELRDQVVTLPPADQLKAEVDALKKEGKLPQAFVLTLRHWGERADKMRIYEAAWIGHRLREAGVRHVHTHFAGIGARTCWWVRQFFGLSYSFTGHANDLFCEEKSLPVTLEMLVRDAALTVAVSDWTADWLRGKFPVHARRIRRVYNGMDLEPVATATLDAVKDDPPHILSVGRLIEKKGFADLIDACALLQGRGVPFQCSIVGEGPLQEELAARIATAGLTGRVRLTGPQPMPEIIRLLGVSRIFALACVVERDGGMDVLPTVIMEAMAARLPCISTRVAGVPEMVEDGVTGLLTAERQPEALAAAITQLLAEPDTAQRMGTAGLARARSLFAREVTAASLLVLLAEHGHVTLDKALTSSVQGLRLAALKRSLRRWSRQLRTPRHPGEQPVRIA